jgi:hypothetical protein
MPIPGGEEEEEVVVIVEEEEEEEAALKISSPPKKVPPRVEDVERDALLLLPMLLELLPKRALVTKGVALVLTSDKFWPRVTGKDCRCCCCCC